MSNDIVAQLRLWSDTAKEQDAIDIVVGLCEAADEIERLREALRHEQEEVAACCIDRRETQRERDEAMALIENIANEVNVLSTRPAAIIKFSDLVDHINEWGDAARKILDKKENTDDR